jgi:hypothetical protein
MGRQIMNLSGQTFGRLTVFKLIGTTKHGKSMWECTCECGSVVNVRGSSLRNGNTKSCGCLHHEIITDHGMIGSRIYRIWSGMKSRIDYLANSRYCDYGGRGISYDPTWSSFEAFFEDMKEGYSEELTLDRVDVNGNYCKDNCRWATVSLQNHNKRKQKSCASNFVGVTFDKRHNVWYARIMVCKKLNCLGTFKTQELAALAYDNASELCYGDRPNKTVREE